MGKGIRRGKNKAEAETTKETKKKQPGILRFLRHFLMRRLASAQGGCYDSRKRGKNPRQSKGGPTTEPGYEGGSEDRTPKQTSPPRGGAECANLPCR